MVRGLHSGIAGVPFVGEVEGKRREESATDDDALMIHLAAAGATCFAVGLDDHQLAERIAGEKQAEEDGIALATRIARLRSTLRQRRSRGKSRLWEKATLPGGTELYPRWHLGQKVL